MSKLLKILASTCVLAMASAALAQAPAAAAARRLAGDRARTAT